MPKRSKAKLKRRSTKYDGVLNSVVDLLESARHASVRSVNAVMTATYWEIGRQIVECEQDGELRAEYGDKLIVRLASDLTRKFGRGFSKRNLEQMRLFFRAWPIAQTVSAQLVEMDESLLESDERPIAQTLSAQSAVTLAQLIARFPLPWSHYVMLLKVDDSEARYFYETEALRAGWSVRQLERQITTLFYERTFASRSKGGKRRSNIVDELTLEEEIKDPFVLEFLGLKDEYSETELEEALIREIENFLLEMGNDFTFVGRQRRLRIGDEWYRIDLLFFHRRLKCLVILDLKLKKFTHADAGQMNLYLNYARKHWTNKDENPPVGVILCTQKDSAVVHYSLDGLPNKILAAEYRITLPREAILAAELKRKRRLLESRHRS